MNRQNTPLPCLCLLPVRLELPSNISIRPNHVTAQHCTACHSTSTSVICEGHLSAPAPLLHSSSLLISRVVSTLRPCICQSVSPSVSQLVSRSINPSIHPSVTCWSATASYPAGSIPIHDTHTCTCTGTCKD